MTKKKRKPWIGGYVRPSRSGGEGVYVIEQWAKGRRFHISTGKKTLEAARKEFAKFELDPVGYAAGHAAPLDAVKMDAALVLEYREHQQAKGLSPEWIDEVTRCLAGWRAALEGRDLRVLHLHRDLKPILAGWPTQRPHRIKAIKGFFRWLREEKGLVDRNQDATLDLKVPQARPEKQNRRKVVPPEDVAAVLKHLPPVSRDVLHLLTATAWHLSEVARFRATGEIVTPARGDVLAVLIVRHKSGDLAKTPILYPEHLEAARRIKALSRFPKRMTLARHQIAACEAAGVPWFGMGQMRHSVLTWGVSAGASIDDAAEFALHRSKATTRRFYVDTDVPTVAIPIKRLT